VHKTKLTPLGRLLAFVLILTTGAIAGAAGAAATRPHAQAWRCITVRPGDTLWTLAGRSEAGERREVIHRIVEHNRLYGRRSIDAGESIWVPNEGDLSGLQRAEPSSCPAAY
jgi:hypothetical protein